MAEVKQQVIKMIQDLPNDGIRGSGLEISVVLKEKVSEKALHIAPSLICCKNILSLKKTPSPKFC